MLGEHIMSLNMNVIFIVFWFLVSAARKSDNCDVSGSFSLSLRATNTHADSLACALCDQTLALRVRAGPLSMHMRQPVRSRTASVPASAAMLMLMRRSRSRSNKDHNPCKARDRTSTKHTCTTPAAYLYNVVVLIYAMIRVPCCKRSAC